MQDSWLNATGIQITIVLFLIIIVAGLLILVLKFLFIYDRLLKNKEYKEAKKEIEKLNEKEVAGYEQREKELNYTLPGNELSGGHAASDEKGIINNINSVEELRFFPVKRRTSSFQQTVSPALGRL